MAFSKKALVLLLLSCLLHVLPSWAQTYRFAQLQGNPLNTSGWRLAGNASVGNTPGNPDPNAQDELILTQPINNTSGAAFFNTPVNIADCQKWVAEFDYRIFDGTGADGLAFCFLADPPTGFVRGGGVGIPAKPRGLMVVLDPWANGGCFQNPELQIRWSDGTVDYSECPFPAQPTIGNVAEVRQPNYNHMKITYDGGNINVFINNVLRLSGFYNISFAGYFGFTASTGGSTDRHSVRNFTMYTFKPILAAPDAGPDRTVCSGTPVSIGTTPPANDPYTYRWYPTVGLDNPFVSNPTLTFNNNTGVNQTLSYFVTKDTLGGVDSVCAFADEVRITVLGKAAQAGADFTLCSGETGIMNVASRTGYSYEWSPTVGLLEPFRSNTRIFHNNATSSPQTFTYVLKAINSVLGCIDYDTINVTVLPKVANAGPNVVLCPGESAVIGAPALPGYTYQWSPATNLSNPNVAQPTLISSVNQNTFPLSYTYTVRAIRTGVLCTDESSVTVTMLPVTPINVGPKVVFACSGVPTTVGTAARSGYRYQWRPGRLVADSNAAVTTITRVYTGTDTLRTWLYLTVTNISGGKACPSRDSVLVKIAPAVRLAVSMPDSICAGQSATARIPSGTAGQFSWRVGANVVSTQPTFGVSFTTSDTLPETRVVSLRYTLGSCFFDTSFSIRILPLPFSRVPRTASVCQGDTVRLGAALPAGRTALWTGTGIISQGGGFATVDASGGSGIRQYFVNITSASGCERRDTVTLTVNQRPQPNAGPDAVVCVGESLALGGPHTGQQTINWSPSTFLTNGNTCCPTFQAPQIDTTLTYVMTATDLVSGCVGTDTVVIGVRGKPRFTFVREQYVCAGDTLTIGPVDNLGYTFSWQHRDGLLGRLGSAVLARAINSTGDTVRQVFYFKAQSNQCLYPDSVVLLVRPAIARTLATTQGLCEGSGPAQISNTPLAGHAYRWLNATGLSSANVANPAITLTLPGIYPFVLETTRLLDGCRRVDTLTLTIARRPLGSSQGYSICAHNPTVLGVPAEPNTVYRWSPRLYLNDSTLAQPTLRVGNNTSSILSLTYIVSAINQLSGCIRRDTINVLVKPELTVDAGADASICYNDSVQLGNPGQPGYVYEWVSTGPLSSTSVAQPYALPRAPGVYTYVLRATFDNCTQTDTVVVTYRNPPVSQLRDFMNICSGDTITVQNPPQPGYTYVWQAAPGLSATNIAEPRVTLVNNTGSVQFVPFIVRINGTDACFRLDTIGVYVQPLPGADAGADKLVCSGSTDTLGTPEVPGNTYRWIPDANLLNGTVARPVFTATNLTDTVVRLRYILEVTSAQGCKSYDTLAVGVKPLPRFNLPATVNVCSGQPTPIGLATPRANTTYLWSNATGLSNATSSNPTLTFTYPRDTVMPYILSAFSEGCIFNDTIQVQLRALPVTPVVVGRTAVCPGVQGSIYRVTNGAAGLTANWRVRGGAITRSFTDSIEVAWGPGNLNAGVSVFFTRADVGCAGDSAVLPVQIKRDIIAPKPVSTLQPDTLCLADAQLVMYQVPNVPFSTYRWNVAGPGLFIGGNTGTTVFVRWQGAGVGRVWINETSTTPTDTCLSLSDTLKVTLLPSPDTSLTISGATRACAQTGGYTYSLAGAPGSTYSWQTTGGNVTLLNGNEITVTWGNGPAGAVQVRETNSAGCPGKLITLNVDILSVPLAVVTRNDSLLCQNNVSGRRYTVATQPGIAFHWNVVNGEVVTANADSSDVTIDWLPNLPAYVLTVTPYNVAVGCRGTVTVLPVYVDRPAPTIQVVGTLENQPDRVAVTASLADSTRFSGSFQLLRRRQGQLAWQVVSPVATGTNTYTDATASATEVMEYQVQGRNACGDTLRSTIQNNIVLTATAEQGLSTATLNWNPYQGWAQAPSYQIWRKLDAQGRFAYFDQVGPGSTSFTTPQGAGKDGFTHQYRIRVEENGYVGWSNAVTLTFANPLTPNNVITANGDGKNDTWYVDNIKLYPGHTITISNRWGQTVLETRDYKNDWDGGQLPAGTYFYLIQHPERGITLRGWLQILR